MTIKGSFDVDVFDCLVHITVSDNVKSSINYYLRKNNDGPIDDDIAGFTYRASYDAPVENNIHDYYVFYDVNSLNINIMNHEKSHVIDYILKDRGIRVHDEVRAFLDGFLSRKFHEFMKAKGIKLKDK